MRKIVGLLLGFLITPVWAQVVQPPGTVTTLAFPDGTTQVSASYSTQNITLSPSCPATGTGCVKIFADTQFVIDATSNSTTTLTCPDCNFTQADVGKVAWAATKGSGAGLYLITTSVCPRTTIASVTNATTVVLNTACTANATANAVFVWGHNDGATLAGINLGSNCTSIKLGTGANSILIDRPFGTGSGITGCQNALSAVMGAPRASFIADGAFASQPTFILDPNFQWSSCAGPSDGVRTDCIGGAFRSIANIQIWGTGLTPAANSNCANASGKVVIENSGSGNLMGVDVAGVCPGQSGLALVEVNGADNFLDEGGGQEGGQWACVFFGSGLVESSRGNDCKNDLSGDGNYGMLITGGAYVTNYASVPVNEVLINGNSTLVSIASLFNTNTTGTTTSAVEVTSGSRFFSYGDTITGGGASGAHALKIDSGGYAFMNGTTHTGLSGAGASIAGTLVTNSSTYSGSAGGIVNASGSVQSEGQNKMTSLPTGSGTASWSGVGVISGACRGTATSSSTLGLFGAGQYATTACTSTTVAAPATPVIQIVPLSGSVFGLQCTATHAGVSASSGVVTVLKNGVATALTCTIGTGTSCSDYGHFDIPTVGDGYGFQFTTQGSEVLAGVTCSLLNW